MSNRFLVLIMAFFFSGISHGFDLNPAEKCQLHPEDFNSRNKESIKSFEKKLEDSMTKVYQREYPRITQALRQLKDQQKFINDVERELQVRLTPPVGSLRPSSGNFHKKMRFRIALKDLLRKEELLESDLEEFNHKHKPKEDLEMYELEHYRKVLSEMKAQYEALELGLQRFMAPGALYNPRLDLSIRQNHIYGNFQWEGFFRAPDKDILRFPLVNAGFDINQNTVIYACINMDAYNPERNIISIYFLRTTKFWAADWSDYISEPKLAFRSLLTSGSEPQAKVSPITLTADPVTGLLGPLDYLFNNIFFLTPFKFVNSFLQRLDFMADAISPVSEFILSNVGIGVKGITITENQYTIRYGMSTFFDLVSFDLARQTNDRDFSPFMNVLAQPSYNPQIYAEEMAKKNKDKEAEAN